MSLPDIVTFMADAKTLGPPACLENADQIVLPVGTRVFQSGDECRQFVYLLSGSIRVDLISKTGKAIMLYRFGSDQTCILTTSCLLSGQSYCAEAHVEEEVTACVLPGPVFQSLLNESDGFRGLVFASISDRLGAMIAKVEEVAFTPIDKRLAARALELAANREVAATHEQLAADLGTAREVVSRKLSLWEKNGWIARGRGGFAVLDLPELQKLANHGD